jgi:hypothetical protein
LIKNTDTSYDTSWSSTLTNTTLTNATL